jgi:hypothetical protein
MYDSVVNDRSAETGLRGKNRKYRSLDNWIINESGVHPIDETKIPKPETRRTGEEREKDAPLSRTDTHLAIGHLHL